LFTCVCLWDGGSLVNLNVELDITDQFRGMVGKCNTNDGDDFREWQREPAPPPTTTPVILFLAVSAK